MSDASAFGTCHGRGHSSFDPHYETPLCMGWTPEPDERADEETEDAGRPATEEELAAIASLKRLAKRWPRSLTLASMGGSLVVYHTDDERMSAGIAETRAQAVLDQITGIPNDGGDW